MGDKEDEFDDNDEKGKITERKPMAVLTEKWVRGIRRSADDVIILENFVINNKQVYN